MLIKYNTRPTYWNKGIKHLKESDPVLREVLGQTSNNIFLTRNCTAFQTLFNAIVGQQISVKAASSISTKIREKIKNIHQDKVYDTPTKIFKNCGLSKQKIIYLKEISEKFINNRNYFSGFKFLDDDTIIQKLCELKGIGKWTAQMYLIFQLNRPNVLPLGDLGFVNSTAKLYKLSKKNNIKKIIEISKKWIPYKTVAVWHIWRIIDVNVIQY